MTLTPSQRAQRARIASLSRWAQTRDRAAATRAGTEGLMNRFRREVDPDGVLPVEERERRALMARRAHMSRLALRSSKARTGT